MKSNSSQVRQAKSYSIVDHELLHGGYLAKLSHAALALYLFLAVVGGRAGKSFYKEATISDILRFNPGQFRQAMGELVSLSLIEFHPPHFQVTDLSRRKQKGKLYGLRRNESQDSISQGRQRTILSPDRARNWDFSRKIVQDILRQLGEAK